MHTKPHVHCGILMEVTFALPRAHLQICGLRQEGPIFSSVLTYFQIATFNPFGLLGVCAGTLACSVVVSPWGRPKLADWFFALIANSAHLAFLYVALAGPSQLNVVILILVFGGGVGFGLGWFLRLLWLTIWPRRII
jgi:hypothetical protein